MPRDTRAALLAAAQSSFTVHGFEGTSIRAVTKAVGIKESSFYNHFPSKQALLEAVLDLAEQRLAQVAEYFQVPLDDLDRALTFYEDIDPGRLEEITAGFARQWLEDRDLIAARRILTLEQFRNPEAGARLRELTIDGPLTFQTRLFSHLISCGAFLPADPESVALAFWGPVQVILAGANGAQDLDEVLRRLRLHLKHFTATHVARACLTQDAPGSRP